MDYELIFKAVVGSQAYGLATPTSDVDIKGVFVQPEEDFLRSGRYIPFIEVNKDECYYELRNFLELLSVGNPTAIELLATPEHCVIHTTPKFEEILKYRTMFITKKLYDSFGGYAMAQIKKAKGLDKKFNWEQSRIEKKDIIDFCTFLGREVGKTQKLTDIIKDLKISQEILGLTKVDGFRDTYKVYIEPAHEKIRYRGVMKEGSNEVRTSEVPKILSNFWIGTMYFNREAYSTHCRDYKSYIKWKESRNETRYKESREGQQYDSKNIMHTARLIMTLEDIHNSGILNIDMSEHRDYLLDIKFGNVDLEATFNGLSERAANITKLKETSDLNEDVDLKFVGDLELLLRKLL